MLVSTKYQIKMKNLTSITSVKMIGNQLLVKMVNQFVEIVDLLVTNLVPNLYSTVTCQTLNIVKFVLTNVLQKDSFHLEEFVENVITFVKNNQVISWTEKHSNVSKNNIHVHMDLKELKMMNTTMPNMENSLVFNHHLQIIIVMMFLINYLRTNTENGFVIKKLNNLLLLVNITMDNTIQQNQTETELVKYVN